MKYFIIIFASFSCAFASPDWNTIEMDSSNGKEQGKSSGQSIADNYKNTNNTRNSLQNPLMGKGKMTTLGESYQCEGKGDIYTEISLCNKKCSEPCKLTIFDPTLQCSVSKEAIVISPKALMPNGEVILSISYDTNLDGHIDKELTTPSISGFCTNGFVSCTSGTLNNCTYYEFAVPHKCTDTNVKYGSFNTCINECDTGCSPMQNYVGFYKSNSKDVGRCDCTNASCGKSFNNAFDSALSTFGTAVSTHMTNSTELSVTESEFDKNSLKVSYLASSFSNCGNSDSSHITKAKKGYSSSTGTADYSGELDKMKKSSDSLYSILTSNVSYNEKECRIINSVITNPAGLSIKNSQNTCINIDDCYLRNEQLCDAVCTPGTVYNQVRQTCEIPNLVIKKSCPDGYTPVKLHYFHGYIQEDINFAHKCGKIIHQNIGKKALKGEIKLNNFSELGDDSKIWDNSILVASLIRAEDGNGRRTCLDSESTKVLINNKTLSYSKLIRSAWTWNNEEVYRSNPYKVATNENIHYEWYQNLKTCGHSSGRPLNKMQLWHLVDIYQNTCPTSFTAAYNNICSKTANQITGLDCIQTVKGGQKTLINKTFCSKTVRNDAVVCADGKNFTGITGSNKFSTSTGEGKYTITRLYNCPTNKKNEDYSSITQARQGINIEHSQNELNVTFIDNTGNKKTINLNGIEEHNEDIYACKILRLNNIDESQISQGKVLGNNNEHFEYRKCVDKKCPFDPDIEKQIQECKKQSDFGRAVSIMNVLAESSKDLICTE